MATELNHHRDGVRRAQAARRLASAVEGAAVHVSRHAVAYGIGCVVLVTVISVALTAQGWRSRMIAFDLVTYVRSAHSLLATGALPQHGDIGSYGSFKPAGTAWLMLPSVLFSSDPRLAAYGGTTLLHFATLLGLFLLARKYFGVWCGCLAVILYGLSAEGLFLAGSLWPNGRPEFFVWMVYLASEWVTRRDARYLAAAIAVWGVGMQVDMGITPAVVILPALWLAYRAPVRVRPLLATAALVGVVWAPYLRFEAPRQFIDIRSQQLFQYIAPANYKTAWCEPGRKVKTVGGQSGALAAGTTATSVPNPSGAAGPIGSGAVSSVGSLGESIFRDKLASNFVPIAQVPVLRPVLSFALVAVVLSSMLVFSVSGAPGRTARFRRTRWYRRFTPATFATVATAVAVHEIVRLAGAYLGLPESAVSPVERITKLLALAGLALLAARWATAALERVLAWTGRQVQTPASAAKRRVLVLSLGIPWLILLVVAEPGKPERFWWLWPLQVLFLAAFATEGLRRLGVQRSVTWLVQAVLIAILLANSLLFSRIESWYTEGWSGRDAPEVQALAYVSRDVRATGEDHAAIGYQVFFYPFMVKYHIINPMYKVGADFDAMLKYRYGITNTNTCAEGLSSTDSYRIVQMRPPTGFEAPREQFTPPSRGGFRKVARFGSFDVLKRVES
jgi:hypothetical protein